MKKFVGGFAAASVLIGLATGISYAQTVSKSTPIVAYAGKTQIPSFHPELPSSVKG